MIRIVGIQRSEWPEREFILLQNQGGLRVKLRGHVVACDDAFDGKRLDGRLHGFGDDALIPPGAYVMLHSGFGEAQWRRTKDHTLVYHTFAGKDLPLWSDADGTVHVLAPQHSYSPPREVLTLS